MKNVSLILLLVGLVIVGFLMKKQKETKVTVAKEISVTPMEMQKIPDATAKHLNEQVKLQQKKLDKEIATPPE